MSDTFKNIGNKPVVDGSTSSEKAEQTLALAKWTKNATDLQTQETANKILAITAEVDQEFKNTQDQVNALQNGETFDLMTILEGWFEGKELEAAIKEIQLKSRTKHSLASVPKIGNMSEELVSQFLNNKAGKASADAKRIVSGTLDIVTGASRKIANDKEINAKRIEEQANKITKLWQGQFDNVKLYAWMFDNLITKVQNRVFDHTSRLENVREDLGRDSVLLDKVSATFQARMDLVLRGLKGVCVDGLALENNIETEDDVLNGLEEALVGLTDAQKGPRITKISLQKDLLSIMRKRSIDLKALALNLQTFYGVLVKGLGSIAAVQADVEFSRTNLMAVLGATLNTIVEFITTMRVSESAQNVREAYRDAAVNLGSTVESLNELTTQTLTDISTVWDAVIIFVDTQISAKKNTDKNFDLMVNLVTEMDAKLNEQQRRIANA